GVPARIVRKNGKKVSSCDLDQIHIPDPVSQELCRHLVRIEKLEKRIKEMEIAEIGKKLTNKK
ncbi:MAG: serine O-acetyltransferase, partial [Oscillospiraceae bacterium]|nr:serine O-acetyltransferase [Oscillospiraceae bacterium]